ncbi:hypothetical protein B0J12DRAFT_677347 [Macrophomina phaseolina]|uniref:Uncharacterized protein n=1 Tax=Macrophomina phaseolina TaxID=35725 RepID=A0ABQ8FZE5_9PEZI|nr:hypothetical protein B0J12DRAFT_677347 [Macrophomina phaseolina]
MSERPCTATRPALPCPALSCPVMACPALPAASPRSKELAGGAMLHAPSESTRGPISIVTNLPTTTRKRQVSPGRIGNAHHTLPSAVGAARGGRDGEPRPLSRTRKFQQPERLGPASSEIDGDCGRLLWELLQQVIRAGRGEVICSACCQRREKHFRLRRLEGERRARPEAEA